MKNIFFILMLVLVLALSACGTSAESSEATPTPYPTPVRPTFTVQRGDIVVTAKIFGRIAPKALHTVTFQMDGHVSNVFVNVGDVVTAGQPLGELSELKSLQAKVIETRRQIRGVQIDLEIAKLILDKYKAENRPSYDIKIQELEVERAQMALDEMLIQLGIDPTTDALEALETQISLARVYSPVDGTLISVVNVGRSVNTTTPAFVIGDPAQLELVAALTAETNDEELKEMFEGMPVTAWREATPEKKLTGVIRQLPSPYGTGPADSREVVIALDQAPSAETYQAGDKMTVEVELANKPNVLWLPPDAIRQASGRTFVVINEASGPKRIEIQIGLKTLKMVEVVSGLSEGQVVVGP